MDQIQLEQMKILHHVKELCQNSVLQGSLHVDDSSSSSAVYTPDCYEREQEKEVIGFFDTNGYVTLRRHGTKVGMSKKRLEECILKHNVSLTR